MRGPQTRTCYFTEQWQDIFSVRNIKLKKVSEESGDEKWETKRNNNYCGAHFFANELLFLFCSIRHVVVGTALEDFNKLLSFQVIRSV